MTFLKFTMRNNEILVVPGANFRIIVVQPLTKDEEAKG
jgi:hypothetical protein